MPGSTGVKCLLHSIPSMLSVEVHVQLGNLSVSPILTSPAIVAQRKQVNVWWT